MKYLVLGNGFDLAHGLKTGYKDFLLYAIKRDKALYNNYTINNNLEVKYIETNNNEDDLYFRNKIKDNIWMSYFVVLYRDKKIRGENWIDFEMEISYIIEIFDRNAKSKLESISEMEEINNSDDNFHLFYKLYGIIYTHDQDGAKNRTYKELIEDLSNDLNDVILAFEYYLQNEVENVSVNIYSPDIKKLGRMDGILSFNYTTTAQRIYDLNGTIDPQHQLKGNEKYRARQNVVFEAGYFMGYLGRENVIMITEENLEIPWDLSGMVYTTKDNWEFEMLKELNAAGMKIDMNKLLG